MLFFADTHSKNEYEKKSNLLHRRLILPTITDNEISTKTQQKNLHFISAEST